MNRAITGKTRVTGVFGCPVQHSQSPAMHNAAFKALDLDYIYVPFEVHPDNLKAAVQAIRALDLVGVNITIPHKERVMEFLDWVSEDAQRIGSVNTIHNCEGTLKGYSTDGPGFIQALEASGKSPNGSKAVIVGAGGAARATASALVTHGADVTVVNRTYSRAVELSKLLNGAVRPVALEDAGAKDAIQQADLLVNCTSVGMYPNTDAQPVPSEWLHNKLFVYDQIYNPLETKLFKAAKEVGAKGANGVKMLVFQGAISFEIWTGQTPPVSAMEEYVLKRLEDQH